MIVAHRGASRLETENTLKAFEKAIEVGADMIEFDVRKTTDGVFVVHHDPNIDDLILCESTFEQAQQAARKKGFELFTFEAALKLTKGRIQLDIELKEEGDEAAILNIIHKETVLEDVVVTSFNRPSIDRIRSLDPKINIGCILGKRDQYLKWLKRDHIDPSLNAYAIHLSLIKSAFLKKFDDKPIFVWTVNDHEQLKQCFLNDRIAGVVTDCPDEAYQIRKELFKT